MIDTVFRYWLIPSFWRRWHPIPRAALLAILIGCAAWLTAIPLFVWLPWQAWSGWDGFAAELIYMAFLLVLCPVLTGAGALTIAPERDRANWESLVVTSFGVAGIVRVKLFARMLRCGVFMSLITPFWIAWAYEVLTVNHYGPANSDSPLIKPRMAIYLSWMAIRLMGHVVSFVSIGLLISSFCRRGRTALVIAIVTNIAFVAVIWAFSAIPTHPLLPSSASEIVGYLCLWPWKPVEYNNYETGSFVAPKSVIDAIADGVWIILIPALCYGLAVYRCKRSIAQ